MSDSFKRVMKASGIGGLVLFSLLILLSIFRPSGSYSQGTATLESLRIVDAARDRYALEAHQSLTPADHLRLVEAAKAQYALETRQNAK